ncbi:MAG: hypothetical protein AAF998_17395 [Bacteroidota bacterium]
MKSVLKIALLFCAAWGSYTVLPGQYLGRIGSVSERAEARQFKQKKIQLAKTYLDFPDSAGNFPGTSAKLTGVRRFTKQGEIAHDTIFHWEDGAPFVIQEFVYHDGRQVRVVMDWYRDTEPERERIEYVYENDWLTQMVRVRNASEREVTTYRYDAQGDIQYYSGGQSAPRTSDTTFCRNNAEGRLIRTTQAGVPNKTVEYTYNSAGKLTAMTEESEFTLFGGSDRISRRFAYFPNGLLHHVTDFDSEGKAVSRYWVEYFKRNGKPVK